MNEGAANYKDLDASKWTEITRTPTGLAWLFKKTKKFKVGKESGAITVPKGTKKGTYKVKIEATAAGDANHKRASKTVTVTIKVK